MRARQPQPPWFRLIWLLTWGTAIGLAAWLVGLFLLDLVGVLW
jgi:hypothetical protein